MAVTSSANIVWPDLTIAAAVVDLPAPDFPTNA
jgi:hypothetical protein